MILHLCILIFFSIEIASVDSSQIRLCVARGQSENGANCRLFGGANKACVASGLNLDFQVEGIPSGLLCIPGISVCRVA